MPVSELYRFLSHVLSLFHTYSFVFSYGTPSVADPWHVGVDPDPDPAIFVIDLQDTNKKLI
jgi:hypothetical protein